MPVQKKQPAFIVASRLGSAIALVYFVQGALGLAELATSFYLKDALHLDPAQACPASWKPVCDPTRLCVTLCVTTSDCV